MGSAGRLNRELLDRAVQFGARILRVVDQLEGDGRSRRVCEQLAGSGAGSGALLFEAAEAMSKADFVKTMSWAAKELNETQYWLTVVVEAKWLKSSQINDLQDEAVQILRIVKTLIARARGPASPKT